MEPRLDITVHTSSAGVYKTDVIPEILSREFVAQLHRATKSSDADVVVRLILWVVCAYVWRWWLNV